MPGASESLVFGKTADDEAAAATTKKSTGEDVITSMFSYKVDEGKGVEAGGAEELAPKEDLPTEAKGGSKFNIFERFATNLGLRESDEEGEGPK